MKKNSKDCGGNMANEERILRETGLLIYSTNEWVKKGCGTVSVSQTIDNWTIAEGKVNELMKWEISMEAKLEVLVKVQAGIFWMLRGAVSDGNIDRQNDDLHDAIRYMGFLIAESIIEDCANGVLRRQHGACFNFVHPAFIDYLISISLEEYIQIKAYHQWKEIDGVDINDKSKICGYYLEEERLVENTRWNCWGNEDIGVLRRVPEAIKKHLSSSQPDEIIKAKTNYGKRRKIPHHESEIKDYVKNFYIQLDSYRRLLVEILNLKDEFEPIVQEKLIKVLKHNMETVLAESAKKVLDIMYKEKEIPNMFEFILRCFICTFVKKADHDKIRKDRFKPGLNVDKPRIILYKRIFKKNKEDKKGLIFALSENGYLIFFNGDSFPDKYYLQTRLPKDKISKLFAQLDLEKGLDGSDYQINSYAEQLDCSKIELHYWDNDEHLQKDAYESINGEMYDLGSGYRPIQSIIDALVNFTSSHAKPWLPPEGKNTYFNNLEEFLKRF